MNTFKKLTLVTLVASLSASPAFADGRGHGGGHGDGGWWIFPALIGGAVAYELTRPQPTYVQPATVYVESSPKIYSTDNLSNYPPEASNQPGSYWYYCEAANAYYPYIQSCSGRWIAVPTTPPVSSTSAPYAPPPPK